MSLTTMTELWRLSATDLVEAIRSRQTSSQEVIEAHLRRIEAVNPSINAVTVVLGEHPSRPRRQPTVRSPVVACRPIQHQVALSRVPWALVQPRRPTCCGRRDDRAVVAQAARRIRRELVTHDNAQC
jgi:hypothetical protein